MARHGKFAKKPPPKRFPLSCASRSPHCQPFLASAFAGRGSRLGVSLWQGACKGILVAEAGKERKSSSEKQKTRAVFKGREVGINDEFVGSDSAK